MLVFGCAGARLFIHEDGPTLLTLVSISGVSRHLASFRYQPRRPDGRVDQTSETTAVIFEDYAPAARFSVVLTSICITRCSLVGGLPASFGSVAVSR